MDSKELDREQRREEFVRLFQQHERRLYGYILSLVPNINAADDISQNTNLLLWKAFDQFDSTKDFGVWARTIAYYQVLTYRKTSRREQVRFNSELVETLAGSVEARVDDLAARQSYLIDCLGRLSEFKRHVIRLYYTFGMTAKAVAQKLGRNPSVVEKTILRSRRSLYDCVETAIRQGTHP